MYWHKLAHISSQSNNKKCKATVIVTNNAGLGPTFILPAQTAGCEEKNPLKNSLLETWRMLMKLYICNKDEFLTRFHTYLPRVPVNVGGMVNTDDIFWCSHTQSSKGNCSSFAACSFLEHFTVFLYKHKWRNGSFGCPFTLWFCLSAEIDVFVTDI